MSRTNHSILRRIATVTAVAASLTGAGAGPAAAYEDLRSPDARDAGNVTVDLRSPDARDADSGSAVDLRSPDARDAGRGTTAEDSSGTSSSGGFEWGYLAVGVASLMLCGGGFAATRRRTRRPERELVASR